MMAMSRLIDSPVHANRTGPYSEDAGGDGLRINAFNHDFDTTAYAGRRFPRRNDQAHHTSEPRTPVLRGRMTGCIRSTPRAVATIRARPLYCKFQPPVGHGPTATRPAVSPYGCSHLLQAVDGSPPHPGRRKPRHSCRPSKSGRTPGLRGRPCRPHSQLRLS